jgi:hypothetical protein
MAVSSATNPIFESGITIGGIQILVGAGAPAMSAAKGSLYINTTGSSTSTRLYVNTNGSTTWTAVTTVA